MSTSTDNPMIQRAARIARGSISDFAAVTSGEWAAKNMTAVERERAAALLAEKRRGMTPREVIALSSRMTGFLGSVHARIAAERVA